MNITKVFLTFLISITTIPVSGEYLYNNRYWNKHSLSYYVIHNTSQMTFNSRSQAITNALNTWATNTIFEFTPSATLYDADIIMLWGSGYHGSCPHFDGYGGVLAHSFSNGTKLLLDNGATMILDGTTIGGSYIQPYAGSTIILNNGAKINKPFQVPLGVQLIINNGKIE